MKEELLHAVSFHEGMEILERLPVVLTLLNLSLPDAGGFKTLTKYLERAADIPVIIISGNHNEIIGHQAVKAGAQDYLVKTQLNARLLGRVIRYSLIRFKTHVKLEVTARELAASEKRYLDAQRLAHFGHWEMDIVANTMNWADEIFRIFQFHPGSFAPSYSDYIRYSHPEDRELVEQFFEAAIKDGQKHELEHRLLPDGRNLRYVSIQAKLQFDELNQRAQLMGVMQDITERKMSEQLLLEKKLAANQQSLREKALAEMSFHVRTPLASVIHLLYLLEGSSTEPQRELIDGLKTSIEDLSATLHKMLNISLLSSESQKQEIDTFVLRDLLQGVQKLLQIRADQTQVALQLNLDQLPAVDKARGDVRALTQLLYNVLEHAILRSPKQGAILLEARGQLSKPGQLQLQLTIAHEGEPLSGETLRRLDHSSEWLSSLQEDQNNAEQPAGLAIALHLLRQLKGEWRYEAGKLVLQLELETVAGPTLQLEERPSRHLRILFVEDHFLNQIATKKILQSWSPLVSVDIAANGQEGVQSFLSHNYDLVLMDIQMPVMDGIEAARRVRTHSETPIIALTANASPQEQKRCLDAGMNDYLSKPFQPADLFQKIMLALSQVAV